MAAVSEQERMVFGIDETLAFTPPGDFLMLVGTDIDGRRWEMVRDRGVGLLDVARGERFSDGVHLTRLDARLRSVQRHDPGYIDRPLHTAHTSGTFILRSHLARPIEAEEAGAARRRA